MNEPRRRMLLCAGLLAATLAASCDAQAPDRALELDLVESDRDSGVPGLYRAVVLLEDLTLEDRAGRRFTPEAPIEIAADVFIRHRWSSGTSSRRGLPGPGRSAQ